MNIFPIYDDMMKKLEDKDTSEDLSDSEKEEICKTLSSLNIEKREIIFIIMKIYYLKHEEKPIATIPYKGRKLKKGIKFNIDNLPNELKWLLKEFITE